MDNKKMAALNEMDLEKVDGGVLGLVLCVGAVACICGLRAASAVAASSGNSADDTIPCIRPFKVKSTLAEI